MTHAKSAHGRRHLWICGLLVGLVAARVAQAAEIFGSFGHWTVLRTTDQPTPGCSIATRAQNGLLRLDLQPAGPNGLIVFVSVTDGPKDPRDADSRVGLSWQPREGQLRVATYPIAGSRVVPGPPVRLFVHAILRKPEEVTAFLNEAFASAGVLISLDPGYDEVLPTAGFSDAWTALKQCDPSHTATLPVK